MRLLLIDTCGETGSVALADGATVVALENLPPRAASSALLAGIRALLERAGWQRESLEGIGVVSGPGSFTGVRVGLAAAKGLCEARGLPLAAVSRLEVLADVAALTRGFAVLNAGRGEVYVRGTAVMAQGRELLIDAEGLLAITQGERVVIAEECLLTMLETVHPELHTLNAASALPAILRSLEEGGVDPAVVDANYVRSEENIYGKVKA
ncbi:MAG TPA: tRNA (adenosine(37)-N6)-threonylcarbamoyltransferase complex dimerization subunit type 1 TsaB [Acidobacteriaceae bacterium]|jgi:tRNA threonylcarbamoyladenosine biosynthesis protein TsaB